MDLDGRRYLPRRLRRSVRTALSYVVVAVVANLFWHHLASTTFLPATIRFRSPRPSLFSPPPDVDYAWGSILHRLQNHPEPVRERPALPPPSRVHARRAPTRVLLVTFELEGLHQNGGIGTAFYELAAALAAQPDFRVSVLLSRVEQSYDSQRILAVNSTLTNQGITLHFVTPPSRPFIPALPIGEAANSVHQFLLSTDGSYDLVHFPENMGLCYFSLLARSQGLALQTTKMIVGLHGAQVEWSALLNKQYSNGDKQKGEQGEMERKSVELADAVVSPSEYMLGYVHRHGWAVPVHRFVVPNIVPALSTFDSVFPSKEQISITELVFFGRLEERKGVRLFLEAVEDLLGPTSTIPPNSISKITYLGRDTIDPSTRSDVSALLSRALTVLQRASHFKFTFDLLLTHTRNEALSYLADASRLVVLPALADNSPSTVLECIAHHIRFIASDVGGVPELVHPADRATVLFKPLKSQLVAKLAEAIVQSRLTPPNLIRPALESVTAPEDWANLLRSIHLSSTPSLIGKRIPKTPLVSICVTHYERTNLVTQLLDSLLAQTYPYFEVIFIDDGSPSNLHRIALSTIEDTYFTSRKDWQLIRAPNAYLGEARNRAASLAKGEYLLFLDDDDVLYSHALSTLVSVTSHTGASALSSWLHEFSSDANPLQPSLLPVPNQRTYWFSGPSLANGLQWNCFGSGNIFVSREAFDDVGGFSTYRDVGGEDWEFWIKLRLKGWDQRVVPEELIWVRSDPIRGSMKYSMDPWKTSFRAISPILADSRVHTLGLQPALLSLVGLASRSTPTSLKPVEPFADSLTSFELSQGWHGWTYSFLPLGPISLPLPAYEPRSIDDHWSTDNPLSIPFINEASQQPYKGSRGTTLAAVRTFRSPKRADVTVLLSYSSTHTCGDGTVLKLVFRARESGEEVVLFETRTMADPKGEWQVGMTVWKGSTLSVVVEPLEDHECDTVDVRLTLKPTKLEADDWSGIVKKQRMEARAVQMEAVASAAFEKAMGRKLAEEAEKNQRRAEGDQEVDELLALAEQVRERPVAVSLEDDELHIALIFDENRLEHALSVVRSAQFFITSRELRFHLVAPVELHPVIEEAFTKIIAPVRLYDHSICAKLAASILPFSDPKIHVSAHCKMFLSEILHEPERVLYLDNDVSIVRDIAPCYSEPERDSTLLSMSIDMGDACQVHPDRCWPIGMHWQLPDGLVCGNLPSRAPSKLPEHCPAAGEVETVQVNGGVILFELEKMRIRDFTKRYVQSVVANFRVMESVAHWGEQDFVNSFFRFYPDELEFLPCGCNYQWWALRGEVKCGNQPVYIAHHWSQGIATRLDKPYTQLFFHFFDGNASAPPPVPLLTASAAGSPNISTSIVFDSECPSQSHDCSIPIHKTPYGEQVVILSRITSNTFAADVVASVAAQTYPKLLHFIAAPEKLQLAETGLRTTRIPLEVDLVKEETAACLDCVDDPKSNQCPAPPSDLDDHSQYFHCFCDTADPLAPAMEELEDMAKQATGWVLRLNDGQIFVSPDAIAHLMAQVDSKDEVLLFKTSLARGGEPLATDGSDLGEISDLTDISYLVHSSHLDLDDASGLRCESWRTLKRLSESLPLRWIDPMPIVAHPLQRHLPQKKSSDFQITIVILTTVDVLSWMGTALDYLQSLSSAPSLVAEFIIFTTDEADLSLATDGVKVVMPKAGSGLAELSEHIKTEGVLLLSDSVFIDQAALSALVNVWLDDPRRLVGPFVEPNATHFWVPPSHGLDGPEPYAFQDEPDSVLGPIRYAQILPRLLLSSSAYLSTLSQLVEKTPLHPRCHGILLNGIATQKTRLPPLRLVLPLDSFTDRVRDCRARLLPMVSYGVQPGDNDVPEGKTDELPSFADCATAVDALLGSREEWFQFGEDVAVTGLHGSFMGIEKTYRIDDQRWLASRRFDQCIKEDLTESSELDV